MHSIIIATVAIIRRESQHHLDHNTTRVSTKKEKIGVGKNQNNKMEKKENEEK